MNELKQIRSMAEMILEKVTALEGANTFSQNSFSEFGPKFKVGDSVCTTVGEAGKITGIHKLDGHYRYRYLVLFDNGDHHHVVEPLLQLIKPEPKFRVGDRVRIEQLVAEGDDAPVGTVVNVYLGSNTIYDISINDDPRFGSGHRRKMVWEKYLTKVVEPKFKVGDRVLCPDDDGIGTVTAVYNEGTYGSACTIQFPSDYGCYTREYYQSDLKLVEEKPKFRVGDRVVGDFDRTTKIGTITLQYGSGGEWYVVEWDDRTTNSVSIHDKHSDNIRLATEADREWHSGPPPHVGWWNASMNESPNTWRWWNGTAWSTACFQGTEINEIGRIALEPGDTYEQECVQWSWDWPANARVPRINPENG